MSYTVRLHPCHWDCRERLVDLEEIDIREVEPAAFQDLACCCNWPGQHQLRVRTDHSEGMYPRPDLQSQAICGSFRGQQQCGSTIADLRGVSCGYPPVFA